MSTEPTETLAAVNTTQLADAQMVTHRSLSRRSFMAATATLAAAGTLATLNVGTAHAATDPDKKKASPDKKADNPADPDKTKQHKKHWWSKKQASGDQPETAGDPDKKKK